MQCTLHKIFHVFTLGIGILFFAIYVKIAILNTHEYSMNVILKFDSLETNMRGLCQGQSSSPYLLHSLQATVAMITPPPPDW